MRSDDNLLGSYERMQKAIFDAAQEPVDAEPVHIPYGRCPRHLISISNGMFDSACPLCEAENDDDGSLIEYPCCHAWGTRNPNHQCEFRQEPDNS